MRLITENQKAVLVTGAAGFIAFHLIEALLRRKTPVLGIDNFDGFYPKEIKEQNLRDLERLANANDTTFVFEKTDIRDMDHRLFAGWDIGLVVHLAAKAGVRPSIDEPEEYASVNVLGTLKVILFCAERGIKEMCFGSSSSVYGDDSAAPFQENARADLPLSPYAATKRSAELLCSTYARLLGMRFAMLRFFTVYGPRQRPDLAIHKFAIAINDKKNITLYGDGKSSRDYTFVTDIVSGILAANEWLRKAADGSAEVFNLGSSSPITLSELVTLVEKNLGRKANIVFGPRSPGDVERTFADISKSKQVLGFAPKVTIENGMAEFISWFMGTSNETSIHRRRGSFGR